MHGFYPTGELSGGPPESFEPSRLELLADDAGVNPWRLREWLREEIERRRQEADGCFTSHTGPRPDGARPSFPPQPRGEASDASRAARV